MIPVDNVYKTVQSLLRKNQQGYVSPAEFNRYANLASQARFNELYGRPESYQNGTPARMAYAQTQLLDEKLSVFLVMDESIAVSSAPNSFIAKPNGLVRIVSMKFNHNGDLRPVKRINKDQEAKVVGSKIMEPTLDYPIYVDYGPIYKFYPLGAGPVLVSYLKKPSAVKWAYSTVSGRPVYTPTGSVDFEWEETEEGNLIAKILTYAGLSVSDNSAVSFGSQQEIKGQ